MDMDMTSEMNKKYLYPNSHIPFDNNNGYFYSPNFSEIHLERLGGKAEILFMSISNDPGFSNGSGESDGRHVNCVSGEENGSGYGKGCNEGGGFYKGECGFG